MKIINISKTNYTGAVYNIEVDEDHTYTLKGGIIVKNCEEGVNSESKFELMQKALKFCDFCNNCSKNSHLLVKSKNIGKIFDDSEMLDELRIRLLKKQINFYINKAKK